MSSDLAVPSPSERLRAKVRVAEPRLNSVAEAFWTHPCLAELYPEFLFLVHSMIRASVPMLYAASRECRAQAHDDDVAAQLADYYARHAKEETGHDEWLLDDMRVLGLDRASVLARLPSVTVASLVGAHYYWIHHVHPVSLMGYLAVLEGNPPLVEQLEEFQVRTGLPAAAFRTLVKHAHIDVGHRRDINRQIDRLSLTPRLASLLTLSALHTVDMVADAIENLLPDSAHQVRGQA